MDFTDLISQIQKNPQNYQCEFENNLDEYSNVVSLPKAQFTHIITYLNFLTTVSHFFPKSQYPKILLKHIESITDHKIKKELINNLFIIKRKKLVDDYTFFKVIINHADLQKILSKVIIEIRDPGLLFPLLKKYIEVGDDKQSTFSAYMICYIYEMYDQNEFIETIIECFFKNEKIQNIVILYVLNVLEFNKNDESRIVSKLGSINGKKIMKHLFDEIKTNTRETRIRKLECIDIIKKKNNLKFGISEFLYKMIDPSKDDLKILMGLLVDNLDGNTKILDGMINRFCSEYHDDDFIVYGLNFLKEVCRRNSKLSDSILEKVGLFNKHKNSAINTAYRGIIKVIKDKEDSVNEIMYVRKKATKEERVEMKKKGVDRSRFKKKKTKGNKKKKIKKNWVIRRRY